jgi:hypothetical protein
MFDGKFDPDYFNPDGIEKGTYTWNAATSEFTVASGLDTNGGFGFSHPAGPATIQLSSDELEFSIFEATGDLALLRIIDPTSVVPVVTVDPASVNGAVGAPFTYSISATRVLTYGAAGLPGGLSLNSTTGAISGSPTTPGTYSVTLSATNSFDATGSGIVTIVIPIPGTPVAASSAGIWLGLKNSDDVGTKFDVLVEVLKNGAVVGTGQLNAVPGGSSGFNNAVLRTVAVAMGTTHYETGNVLAIRVSVRIAVGVSGHRSGTARLWFGDAVANTNGTATVNGQATSFHFVSGNVLTTAPGTLRKTVDVFVDRLVNGNPFKPFGTWTITF